MASDVEAKKAPPLKVPKSDNCCQLSIINTTTDITVPTSVLVEPYMDGHKYLNLPTYAYYIKNEKSGDEVLFDAGARVDWWNAPPHIHELVRDHVPGIRTDKSVTAILREGGVDPNNLKAFILSHWHFDHGGDPALLAKSTDVVVGPGFKAEHYPGWPTTENSTYHEEAFKGRNVIELEFSDDFKIGQFQAKDFLGDGSLYILNVPGHATGHISALVRTTPDTFVVLGGDVCHFTGMLRPSEYIPLPDKIPEETALHRSIPVGCPCSAFTPSHPNQDKCRTSPFYRPSTDAASFYADPPLAAKSLHSLQDYDADPNVLITIAHDRTPLDVFDFFPNGTMNDWKAKGWREKMHWGFVSELPYNGKTVTEQLVDGLYREGKRVRDMAFNWF